MRWLFFCLIFIDNADAVVVKSGNKANVTWSPSVVDQEKLSSQGVGGKFVVQYDINRDSTSGEVLVGSSCQFNWHPIHG